MPSQIHRLSFIIINPFAPSRLSPEYSSPCHHSRSSTKLLTIKVCNQGGIEFTEPVLCSSDSMFLLDLAHYQGTTKWQAFGSLEAVCNIEGPRSRLPAPEVPQA